MYYSYVVNNTQAKNKKEKEIDNKLLTFHLRLFRNIEDIENFIHFISTFIAEKNGTYQRSNPLKVKLILFEKIKGNFFLTCEREDGSCFFTLRIQKLGRFWNNGKNKNSN